MTNGAPTKNEVEKAISRLHGRADCSSIFGDVKKSMGENEELVCTIRAHISALEAENKRLREAHLAIIEHDWRAGDVNNKVEPQPARLLGKCALISQSALAQTGEK